MKKGERSELISYEGLRHAPENELGVVLLFGKIHRQLGFPEIDVVQPAFPDCWALQKTTTGTRKIWIEFEFRSRSFHTHIRQLRGLKPKKGVIVCWEHNSHDASKYAEIIELKSAIGFRKRVWIQCTNPEFQNEIDATPRKRKRDCLWTVSQRARPGDILLMYRSGTRFESHRYETDETLLQSIANVFEVTSHPEPHKVWRFMAHVRQIAKLEEPLRYAHMRSDPFLCNSTWIAANLRGRPEVTAHWWRLKQLILEINPKLRKNKYFLEKCRLN